MAAVLQQLDNLELNLCVRVNQLSRHVAIRNFFSIISKLGDGGAWVGFGVVLYAIHGNEVLPELIKMALIAGLGVAIYKGIKNKLVRQRPYISHGVIECGTKPLDQYSFPSGHTLHATAFTIMIAKTDPLLAAIALPFALLVGASRVILGLHYPSDVFVGAAIGATLALAIY